MAWVWLLQQQAALYCRHRIAIPSVLRLLLALVGAQTTRRMQMQLHGPAEVQQPLPVFAAGMQLLLLTNTVHIPMLAVRLPMPMLLQLLLTAAQPAMLLAGGVVRGEHGQSDVFPACWFHLPACSPGRHGGAVTATRRRGWHQLGMSKSCCCACGR